jgi:methylated-DNA-[protein]-cysteine S-methyltransferase
MDSSSHAPVVGNEEFRASTPWGAAVITARGPLVTGLRPPLPDGGDDTRERTHDLPSATSAQAPEAVRDLADALEAYLDGKPVELAARNDVDRWLTAAGVTGFRHDVSMTLFDVPRGVTLSYGELAALAGSPGAARAVGSACARNPLPIVIPCHRVVNAGARHGDVGLYGAATGTDYKRRLLVLEDAALVRVTGGRLRT